MRHSPLRRAGILGAVFGAVVGGAVVALAAGTPAALAASPSPSAAPRVGLTMEARALLQGHVRTGSWMAIRVDLANDGPPFAGEIRLVGGTQGRTRFAVPVDLPTTSRKTYQVHVQAPAFGSTLEVALVADEAVVAKRTIAFALHDPGQLVVGVVAEHPGPLVAALGQLRDATGLQPAVVMLEPADLPERPEAWSALDRIAWQDIDPGRLSAEQLGALRTWLASGGRLTVLAGSGGPAFVAGFPAELLPFRPGATREADPGILRDLLGGTLPSDAASVPAIAGPLAAGARALASTGGLAVVADRPFGSGAVTLAGIDPATSWVAGSPSVDTLWATLVPARGTSRAPLVVGDDGMVVSLLGNMPGLSLPPVEGLLLLLIAYIVLIGPLNYLVLRRLDRREWAWVTMPLLVGAFTVASFAIGSSLRGTEVVVNELALVRAAPGTDAAQAQVYVGVFSPTRGTFEVALPGGALLSAPYGGEGFNQAAEPGLDLVQGDPARIRGLAVGYGTLRAVRAEAPVSAPRIEADLRLEGDRVRGAVRNASDRTLVRPVVVLGAAVAILPDLAPGASADVELRSTADTMGQQLSDRVFGGQAFSADGRLAAAPGDLVRRQIVDALTYDPFFGSYGTLPADGPVLLAWGEPGLLPVEVAGVSPRMLGETLYYVPLALTAGGPAVFTPDLMRSSVVEAKAQFFSKDPFNISIGGGTVTLAYRPIPVSGTFAATRLAIGVNLGQLGPLGAGGAVAPVAPPVPGASPEPAPIRGDPGLPGIELFDRDAGSWRVVPEVVSGRVVEISRPARFVDPASGTILVRLTSERQDGMGLQLALQLEGEIR